MSVRLLFVGLACLSATSALAASDVKTTLSAPSGTYVYESGTYTVTVSNIGNKTASAVSLTIDLPKTHTSPQVFILGTLGTYDSRCTLSGQRLTCALGSLGRGKSTNVSFALAMPQNAAPLVIAANATTTSSENSTTNNGASHTATLLNDTVTVPGGSLSLNEHCTGTGLTSFMECEYFPSSISSHEIVFEANGTITFVDAPSGYTGTWTQPSGTRLQFQYYNGTSLAATFDGYGVSGSCFEGMTTFPGSTWVSPYSVCLQ